MALERVGFLYLLPSVPTLLKRGGYFRKMFIHKSGYVVHHNVYRGDMFLFIRKRCGFNVWLQGIKVL